jgi:hypothetical protein
LTAAISVEGDMQARLNLGNGLNNKKIVFTVVDINIDITQGLLTGNYSFSLSSFSSSLDTPK